MPEPNGTATRLPGPLPRQMRDGLASTCPYNHGCRVVHGRPRPTLQLRFRLRRVMPLYP